MKDISSSLLNNFDRIAEAPDAVPRLRRFILDLAVRGKLVEQDPIDEPASELLKRVSAEKAQMVKVGEIPRASHAKSTRLAAPAFAMPTNWHSAKIADVLNGLQTGPFGSSLHQSDYQIGGTPVINPASIQDECIVPVKKMAVGEETLNRLASFKLRVGDIIMARRGEMGRCAVVREPEAGWLCGTGSLILRPSGFIYGRFLVLLIGSPYGREYLGGSAVGSTMQNLNQSILLNLPFGLPPLAEQHRIVAKVDELMALCDRLEAAQTKREQRRDRLAAASLNRINQPASSADGEAATAFREHARFHLAHLPRLTTRPEHIKALRQTILNLAVRGSLVDQDPSDEPASRLLERIVTEKVRLVMVGEIRRGKTLPPLSDADRAFELPPGWAWARLGDLSKLVTSGSRDWAKHYSSDGAIFVRMGNLSKDHYHLRLEHIQRVSPPSDGEGTRTRLEGGDILISITGDVGMLGLIPEGFGEAYINQHTAMVRPMPETKGRYLAELFRSPFAQDQFNEPKRGIKNSFRLTDVTQFVVPLPPLSEQNRIVAKVDELMAVCDQLEAQLTTTQTDSRRLLEAVLHEALAPAMEEAA